MVPLNETTIAMYGADSSEEGAMLCIYNLNFKLVQATQKLKLYTNDAKLWKIEDKLLLAANRHLAVAPFRLAPQRLLPTISSSLNNKNQLNDKDVTLINNEPMVLKWKEKSLSPVKVMMKKSSKKMFKEITTLKNGGYSNFLIPQVIIPKLIESKDVSSLLWCLDNFPDLSEKLLVDLLSFSLRTSDIGKSLKNGDVDKDPSEVVSNIQNEFLSKIFHFTYTDIYLLKYLKSNLGFKQVLKLLENLVKRISCSESSEPDFLLFKWINLLLDSHYQDYILATDPDILNQLKNLEAILDEHVSYKYYFIKFLIFFKVVSPFFINF